MNLNDNTYLKFDKSEAEPDTYFVHAVTTNIDKKETVMNGVAVITNWESGEPSIKVPYYIPNSMIEEICQTIQKKDPPQ